MRHRRQNYIRQKICVGISLAVSIFCYSCGSVAYAAEEIRSCGSLVYEEAGMPEVLVYDGSDIQSIQKYLDLQKEYLLQKLLQLGTAFVQTEEGWIYSRNPADMSGNIPVGEKIGWNLILGAVMESQNVPENVAVANPKVCLQIEGITEYTDCYHTATVNNISKGKAAWLEGVLLLGTGADNEKAYEKGKKDGTEGVLQPDVHPIYAASEQEIIIRHKHIGSREDVEGISGCYHNYLTTEIRESVCGATLQPTEATWYPNESEEGGGSWHGGYYTCPWHGGLYEAPGICTSMSSQETSVWNHDIICGKTNMQYATLRITGIEGEYTDGKIMLQEELTENEGFSGLMLPEEESSWLIWSNEAGEVIGTGSMIEVEKTGTYFCKLAATNQDVEHSGGSIQVIMKGFTY